MSFQPASLLTLRVVLHLPRGSGVLIQMSRWTYDDLGHSLRIQYRVSMDEDCEVTRGNQTLPHYLTNDLSNDFFP